MAAGHALTPRILALLVLCLLGVSTAGCPRGGVGRSSQAYGQELAVADALYDKRLDLESLEGAISAYNRILEEYPEDTRILGRLARASYALAYGFEPSSPPVTVVYEMGREYGWRCLAQEPPVAAALVRSLGRVTGQVSEKIPENLSDCTTWMGACWIRWLAVTDPGAMTLDADPIKTLADRAVAIHASEGMAHVPRAEVVMALDLAGLTRALAPESYGQDLPGAESLLRRALALKPDDLSVQVDLSEHVLLPMGHGEEARALLEGVRSSLTSEAGDLLEDERARERARLLLADLDRSQHDK